MTTRDSLLDCEPVATIDLHRLTTFEARRCLTSELQLLSRSRRGRIVHRLKESAACLVADEYGPTAHMERLMHRLGQSEIAAGSFKRILELNPDHPAVQKMRQLREEMEKNPLTVLPAKMAAHRGPLVATGAELVGNYAIKIGSDIRDVSGNRMDQDQDDYIGLNELDRLARSRITPTSFERTQINRELVQDLFSSTFVLQTVSQLDPNPIGFW